MPTPFAPPQPKQLFSGFGSRRITLLMGCGASDQRYAATLSPTNSAFTLAHLCAKNISESCDAARNRLFVQAGKSKPQRIRLRALHVKIAARGKEHAALLGMNQELTGIKTKRQLKPNAHAAIGQRPAGAFGHMLAQCFVQRAQAGSVNLPHFGQMLGEEAAAYE